MSLSSSLKSWNRHNGFLWGPAMFHVGTIKQVTVATQSQPPFQTLNSIITEANSSSQVHRLWLILSDLLLAAFFTPHTRMADGQTTSMQWYETSSRSHKGNCIIFRSRFLWPQLSCDVSPLFAGISYYGHSRCPDDNMWQYWTYTQDLTEILLVLFKVTLMQTMDASFTHHQTCASRFAHMLRMSKANRTSS